MGDSTKQHDKCENEPNFAELFKALGDFDKQEEIRKENPDVTHCEMLLMDPNACDGCKLNPTRNREGYSHSKDTKFFTPLIERTLELYDYVEMGLINDLNKVTPLEALLLRVVHNYYRSMKAASSLF